jgi:hypothetical protein
MASTTKATRGAGATLGTKCLTDMEYGHNCTAVLRFDGGDEINDAAGVPILKLAAFPKRTPRLPYHFHKNWNLPVVTGEQWVKRRGGCRLLAMNRDYVY